MLLCCLLIRVQCPFQAGHCRCRSYIMPAIIIVSLPHAVAARSPVSARGPAISIGQSDCDVALNARLTFSHDEKCLQSLCQAHFHVFRPATIPTGLGRRCLAALEWTSQHDKPDAPPAHISIPTLYTCFFHFSLNLSILSLFATEIQNARVFCVCAHLCCLSGCCLSSLRHVL